MVGITAAMVTTVIMQADTAMVAIVAMVFTATEVIESTQAIPE